MNRTQVQLFGIFRSWEPTGKVTLEVPVEARIADLRAAMRAYAGEHWPALARDVLVQSAFADETRILHDDDVLAEGAVLAILPPVNGG